MLRSACQRRSRRSIFRQDWRHCIEYLAQCPSSCKPNLCNILTDSKATRMNADTRGGKGGWEALGIRQEPILLALHFSEGRCICRFWRRFNFSSVISRLSTCYRCCHQTAKSYGEATGCTPSPTSTPGHQGQDHTKFGEVVLSRPAACALPHVLWHLSRAQVLANNM